MAWIEHAHPSLFAAQLEDRHCVIRDGTFVLAKHDGKEGLHLAVHGFSQQAVSFLPPADFIMKRHVMHGIFFREVRQFL